MAHPRLNIERMDPGVREAVIAAGGIRPLARALGILHTTIIRWRFIPIERLLQVEKVTGVPRERLRPDIFRKS
jgi:DNA-binding transcriptional regulator YdaS (Cro superfamily)